MGTIRRYRQQTPDITEFVVEGRTDASEILDELTQYYASQDKTPHTLWDFREADLSTLSTHDIQLLAEFIAKHSQTREGSKAALVFSSDLDYGIGRMVDALLELEFSPVSMQSFKDRPPAQAWLNEPDA